MKLTFPEQDQDLKLASLHPLSSSSGTLEKAASMKEMKMKNTQEPDQVSIA